MYRFLTALLCVAALVPKPAGAASVTGNLAITVTGSPSPSGPSSCPDDDGSAGAAAGTPNLPNLLSGYRTAIDRTAANGGLGCKVAGVDYPVGVPAGTVLKDPTVQANLPAGAIYSGGTVTISSNNVTLSGFDFGAHGVSVQINAGVNNTVIQNSNFIDAGNDGGGGSIYSANPYYTPIGNLTVKNNNLGYNGSSAGIASGATLTIEYNLMKGAWEDNWDVLGPHNSTSDCGMILIVKYNLWQGPKGLSVNSGGHPDGFQYNGGNFCHPAYMHNTYYNPAPGWDQPYHIEAQINPMSVITGPITAFNTMIQPAGGTCTGICGGNYTMACKQDGSPPNFSVTGYVNYGNYVDASAVSGHWALGSIGSGASCPSGSTTFGAPYSNVGMNTGQICSTSPSSTDSCN